MSLVMPAAAEPSQKLRLYCDQLPDLCAPRKNKLADLNQVVSFASIGAYDSGLALSFIEHKSKADALAGPRGGILAQINDHAGENHD